MSLSEPLRPEASGAKPPLGDAECAILRTVAYAAVFQAPLSVDELHRRLMDVGLGREELRARLDTPLLRQRLSVSEDVVYPRGEQGWLGVRRERQARTASLMARHRLALRCLARFPFVRLLALSGACAHDNATDDDVDLFLVVKRNRAWAVCLTLMACSKLMGLRRSLCINYIVDEDGMSLPEVDLFTASEIVGLKVLAGEEAYRRFLAANAWVGGRFPNFWSRHARDGEGASEPAAPRWLEGLLDLGVAPLLEAFSRRVLGAYLGRKAKGSSGVVLAPHRLKLHIHDHRPRLLVRYDAALAALGIDAGVKEARAR
jgi:hypothetical protein